jgi:flagellar hook-length control protein FliK
MKVNINVESYTSASSKKLETSKQSPKKDEFKRVLDNHEKYSKNSSNEKVNKAKSKDLEDDNKKTKVESSDIKSLNKDEKNDNSKTKVVEHSEAPNLGVKKDTESSSKELLGQEKYDNEIAQIQQLLQSISSLFQNVQEDSLTKDIDGEEVSINLEQLPGFEKLTASSKDMLSSKISEIVAMLEKSKGNTVTNSQILEMLQKYTNEVSKGKGDLNLLKIPSVQVINLSNENNPVTDNSLKELIKASSNAVYDATSKSQMQNSNDASKDGKSSGNTSSEEKFLSNFLSEDKDEMKISKAVNFMNQFENVKTLESSKVQTPNLVIDKSNLGADVIKTIKFMEVNNVKDLTVKMNPKELGEVTIKIIVESGVMKASISAQNKETYNLLNQNMQDISDKLKTMDIKIQSLDINIYEDSTFFNKNSNGSNDGNNKEGKNNNSNGNMNVEEDISIRNTYSIEENQVNKFV